MMAETDPRVLPYMNDHRMNLAAPGMMTDEEIRQYQTGLREVMFFIKYSEDREKLMEIMESDRERFETLEREAADVIEAVTNSGLKYKKGSETVNTCKAIRDIRKEAYDQGIQSEKSNTLREKERADAAENRADTEKSRADAAERELLQLKEEILRLRIQLAGGN